jgi:hypothetical protein
LLSEAGWHVRTPEVKLKSGDVGSGFCFVVGQILTLLQDLFSFLCLIQELFLFVQIQQLAKQIFQCEITFPILRKYDAAQHSNFSNYEKNYLHHETTCKGCELITMPSGSA